MARFWEWEEYRDSTVDLLLVWAPAFWPRYGFEEAATATTLRRSLARPVSKPSSDRRILGHQEAGAKYPDPCRAS